MLVLLQFLSSSKACKKKSVHDTISLKRRSIDSFSNDDASSLLVTPMSFIIASHVSVLVCTEYLDNNAQVVVRRKTFFINSIVEILVR